MCYSQEGFTLSLTKTDTALLTTLQQRNAREMRSLLGPHLSNSVTASPSRSSQAAAPCRVPLILKFYAELPGAERGAMQCLARRCRCRFGLEVDKCTVRAPQELVAGQVAKAPKGRDELLLPNLRAHLSGQSHASPPMQHAHTCHTKAGL